MAIKKGAGKLKTKAFFTRKRAALMVVITAVAGVFIQNEMAKNVVVTGVEKAYPLTMDPDTAIDRKGDTVMVDQNGVITKKPLIAK
ncbi:hypothetical protein [Flammeovirga pacifica]|nr:hypothetical protein [Flammeovirga pacifica]